MKNIKDYLHLYLGCKCETEGANIVKLSPEILQQVYDGKQNVVPFLRRLSDITEDEETEVIKMAYEEEQNRPNLKLAIASAGYPEVFKHLLSKHFDLFGLIEERLAIDTFFLPSLPISR